MSSALRYFAFLPLATLLAANPSALAAASDNERHFFERVQGQWSGPGEIVAGKYKGTKFVCNFAGSAPEGTVGMALDGDCRVGVFNQAMSAKVERGQGGFRGSFLDGAEGKGLDVVGGAVEKEYAVFAIHRNALTGAMRAQLAGKDQMNITISVHVDEELVPVIGLTLKRVDRGTVSAITE